MKTSDSRQKDKNGYLILPLSFTEKGFDFKQIWRKGNYAIYEKTKNGTQIKNYEVIKIFTHEGYVIANNEVPPSEIYPSSERFGDWAFDCLTKEDAFKRLEKMKKSRERK